MQSLPFLFGSQYYRAPTPESECWEVDLCKMHQLGMNSVKFWVQWRWSHRLNDRFFFEDVDRLMDLAHENGLQVTLNTVFDVAPHWLYAKYPDARQVMNNGQVIEPYTVAHRQLGGHPGPCYNHPGALQDRQAFFAETIRHFRSHPALSMWDVWNEPELSFPQRTPDIHTLACYCPNCHRAFLAWLAAKYESLGHLNQVWGRCYEEWDQVEMPRSAQAITDFVDWREFHLDTMTSEANWRLALLEALDPDKVRYLHVVPNVMSVFNSVTCCADDFQLAKKCQVFAATMNGGPVYAPQVLSAARGKVCYNVESHLNFGATSMHQRVLTSEDLLRDWLPQIGLGIRGFMFWQFRSEVLGWEAPAWGVVNLDGSDRPISQAVAEFWHKLSPLIARILDCPPRRPQIGIWKSRRNELFQFAVQTNLNNLVEDVEGYIHALYWSGYAYRIINEEMLENQDLDDLKLLILPACYYMSEKESTSLDAWIHAGGIALSEAHLAGYNATSGRHSRQLPGNGLSQSWDLSECNSTSSFHLKLENSAAYQGSMTEDVRKALRDQIPSGGQYFPIRRPDGSLIWGSSRYAELSGKDFTVEGSFSPGIPCLVSKPLGLGAIFYCATNLGEGAKIDPSGLIQLLHQAAERAGIRPISNLTTNPPGQVRVDILEDSQGPAFLTILNRSSQTILINLDLPQAGTGLFSGRRFQFHNGESQPVPGNFIDLVVLDGPQ